MLRCGGASLACTKCFSPSKGTIETTATRICYDRFRWLASHEGVGVMNKLVEIRSQELMCRERAALDSERRFFWLAQAEEWEQRALDEIAYHFRECNPGGADARSTTH
jgi:hypothetical protein